jgi:hypothetical protein
MSFITEEVIATLNLWDGIEDSTEVFVPIQDAPNKKNTRSFYADILESVMKIPVFLSEKECDDYCVKTSSGPSKKLKTYKTTYGKLCTSMQRVSKTSQRPLECWLTGLTMVGNIIRVQLLWTGLEQ